MEALHPGEQLIGRVRFPPDAGDVFAGFRQGWVDMHSAEDLVQANAMAHGQDVLGQQVAGVFTSEGDAQSPVFAGYYGEHLDETVRLVVGNRPIQIVEILTSSPA